MTVLEVIDELKALGKPSIKKVLVNHGAREPFFGVSIEDLKKIQKRIKKDHELALELYETGISDAMYLAGMIVDDSRMTRKDLNRWVKAAYWSLLNEHTVPGVAADGPLGWPIGLEWIESPESGIAAAGWSTLSGVIRTRSDAELDMGKIGELLDRIASTIHDRPNRVKLVMNGFIINLGSYAASWTDRALEIADTIGVVTADMGETACKVPVARASIEKVQASGKLGQKRKTAKC